MQSIRNSILSYVKVRRSIGRSLLTKDENVLMQISQWMCSTTGSTLDQNQINERVIGLVKKFDKTEASMVTETADFQKDLSLDSLDRVELVMAFEEEFSIEIPEEKADKLTCCADVAKYIVSEAEKENVEKS
ncbi:Acyl carrier protein [Quillaja saponaria]|uniref:Acyl carrier protein n=1 Tax=Quillaja saponaria TaxID=32244 RepID=A0AAD7KV57_QUISA|nr:Acyl carrier protein [Quillaja saponaria]